MTRASPDQRAMAEQFVADHPPVPHNYTWRNVRFAAIKIILRGEAFYHAPTKSITSIRISPNDFMYDDGIKYGRHRDTPALNRQARRAGKDRRLH
jgi:hypothetical protein